MSVISSGFSPAAASASQAGTTVDEAPSPRAVFFGRLSAVLRILAIVNPIALLIFHGVFLADACPRDRVPCHVIWHATFIAAVLVLAWTFAVTLSILRTLRGFKGLPYLIHANIAAVVALGTTVVFGIVVAQVVKLHFHIPMSWWATASIMGFTTMLMVLSWNEFAWSIWGWKWLKKNKLEARELFGHRD